MSYLSNTTSLTRAAPIPDTALRIGLVSSSASPDSSLDSMAFSTSVHQASIPFFSVSLHYSL